MLLEKIWCGLVMSNLIVVALHSFFTLVCLLFLRDHHDYFLACTPLINSGKSISQYASYSLIFNPLHSVINREQLKRISTINPAITKIMKCWIVEVCASVIDLKVGVLLGHHTSFQANLNTFSNIPSKK